MTFDSATLWAFFAVFVRASAMLLSSPIFGAQHTPVTIRVLTTLSISAALTMSVKSHVPPVPQDLWSMAMTLGNEALAGLCIGIVLSLVFYAMQMAGSFMDFQIGLGSSQVINPSTGVPVTIVSQFKFILAVVVFLAMNGHHAMIFAFARSYESLPMLGFGAVNRMQETLLPLLGTLTLLALQIAAPIAAVSMIIDTALGIVNKAVPQMQVLVVGMPAKIAIGLITLSVTLPVIVAGVDRGVDLGMEAVWAIGSKDGK